MYLVFAFLNSSHGVQANDYKRTCVGVLKNKYWNKQLMTFFMQAYGIQIWFVGVFLLLAYSIQKQKMPKFPYFLDVSCFVHSWGLVESKFKGLNAFELVCQLS